MEVNRDEAERCIQLAEQYMKERNRDKAEKFLYKAERLYPTSRAKDLLVQVKLLAPGAETEQPRRRKASSGAVPSGKNEDSAESAPSKAHYTTEQLDAVRRIKTCKDYYEILGINKDATDSDIKKAYKKLALQFHPDKNKCPGSAEAFKAIGNAVAVLTDPEKRKQYDLYGSDEDRMSRSHQARAGHAYSRGFESDATAEELFNMFFGGGFGNSNVFIRRNGRVYRQTTGSSGDSSHSQREQQQSGFAAFFQLLPILLAILLSMASSLFISDPAYSLQMGGKYTVPRKTENLNIPYFVKENFHSEYQGSVRRLEMSIEEDYLTNLRHSCFREKNYRDSMLWKARNFGDQELYKNAYNIKMPSCERLQEFRNRG